MRQFLSLFRKIRETGLTQWLRWQVAVGGLMMNAPVGAQINKPTVPGSSGGGGNVFTDVKAFVAAAAELLIYLVLLGGYLVAAWMIISGAYMLFKDREGGVQRFVMGVVVAIIMVLLMTYFLSEGESALKQFREG